MKANGEKRDRRQFMRKLLTLGAAAGIAGVMSSPGKALEPVYAATGSGLIIDLNQNTGSSGTVLESDWANISGIGTLSVLNHGASAGSSFPTAIYAEVTDPSGIGISAKTLATSGFALAVYGASTDVSGSGTGVLGASTAPSGNGVVGEAFVDSPNCFGVWGITPSTTGGVGVAGLASASSGANAAVYGETHAPMGVGVQGTSFANGGVGVYAFNHVPGSINIVAQAASGQLASLQEWWNSSGTPLSAVNANGNFGIGVRAPLAPLHVHAATNENYLARDINVALGKPPGTFLGVGFQGANDAFSANVALGFIGSPIMIAGGNVYMGQTAPSTAPTQQLQMQQGAFCTGTVWVNASDRNLKENFTPLDEGEILDRLESIPIQKWNYKDRPKATHIGPVAQDFYAAYELGEDDKSIGTVDADGIAFAAIKALHKAMKEQQVQSKQFKEENEKLRERIAILERTVKGTAAS